MKTLLTCLLALSLGVLSAGNIGEDSVAVQNLSTDTATCDPNIYVPKSFCPNCDGLNDIFYPIITGEKPESIEMIIYDRWGTLVYKQTSVSPVWDGSTADGKQCVEGAYMWIITMTYAKASVTCTGFVVLQR